MDRYRHSGLFAFEAQDAPGANDDDDRIVIPDAEAIKELPDEGEGSLAELLDVLNDAFDTVYDNGPSTPDAVAKLEEIAQGVEAINAEKDRRKAERDKAAEDAEALRKRVKGETDTPEEPDDDDDEADAPPAPAPADEKAADKPAEKAPDKEPALVAGAPQTQPAEPRKVQRLNVRLSEVRARAPKQDAPAGLVITAAADVPQFQAGQPFADALELAGAYRERAVTTPISQSGQATGPKVAQIKQQFEYNLTRDTPAGEVERIIKEMTNPQSLVAGGGWCAPSEVSYEFFDISCEDGMVDLPTAGIQRGGLRFPVSPSMADVFTGTFTNASNPWIWSETDDILTVTGSTNKPCVRVPCPTFSEVRLECYGICLIAGNLTDNAFPEATRHQLGLLRSAHYHAQNQRYLASMVALSTPVATGGFLDESASITSDLLAAAGWAAVDYRSRFGMCETAILEVVLPFWAREVIRSDLSRRTGVELLAVSDDQIDNYFDVRRVRVQWVKDWQVRGTNQPGGATPTSLYPATVQFLMYAAGTFIRGNGMTLDLGVVRDSVLNAENDHTAAWMEECHLIAMMGNTSRVYTVNICAAGRTGSANITGCGTA